MASCAARQPLVAGCRGTAAHRSSRRRMQPVRATAEVGRCRPGMHVSLGFTGRRAGPPRGRGRRRWRRQVQSRGITKPVQTLQAQQQRKRPEYIPNRIDDPNYVRIFDTTLRDGEQSPGEQLAAVRHKLAAACRCCLACGLPLQRVSCMCKSQQRGLLGSQPPAAGLAGSCCSWSCRVLGGPSCANADACTLLVAVQAPPSPPRRSWKLRRS